jgi:signal transduction histidine kinase
MAVSSAWASKIKLPLRSLRAKVALLIGLPILLALIVLSLLHYWRAKYLAEERIEITAQQLGEITLGNLNHAMMLNDSMMLGSIMSDLGDLDSVQLVQIIDPQFRVHSASDPTQIGLLRAEVELGCQECHQQPPQSRPHSTHLAMANDVLRVSTPIDNLPACTTCHQTESPHLGVLLVDISLADTRRQLLGELRNDLAISLLTSSLLAAGAYMLIHRLVVRRVERFGPPLARLASGDFGARLPAPERPSDELDQLAATFNRMAQDLEHSAREEAARSKVRLDAIIEERERIARELHDGLAQLLGYVNTKASAVRLLLHDGKEKQAEKHLSQLEEAAREVFIDVREAILGLKLAANQEGGFTSNLRALAEQFSRLSDLQIDLSVAPDAQDMHLSPEAELQLLRISQEALTNARKHAATEQVHLRLSMQDGTLLLEIQDRGVGFATTASSPSAAPGFGLTMMRERAREIGATIEFYSEPGLGTKVLIRLPIRKD